MVQPNISALLALLAQENQRQAQATPDAFAALGRGATIAGQGRGQFAQQEIRNREAAARQLASDERQKVAGDDRQKRDIEARKAAAIEMAGLRRELAALSETGANTRLDARNTFSAGQTDKTIAAGNTRQATGIGAAKDAAGLVREASDKRFDKRTTENIAAEGRARTFTQEGRDITAGNRAGDIARKGSERVENIKLDREREDRASKERLAGQLRSAALSDNPRIAAKAKAIAKANGIDLGLDAGAGSPGLATARETLGAKGATASAPQIEKSAPSPRVIRVRGRLNDDQLAARARTILSRKSLEPGQPAKSAADAVYKKLLEAVEVLPDESTENIVDAALLEAQKSPGFQKQLVGITSKPRLTPTSFTMDGAKSIFDSSGKLFVDRDDPNYDRAKAQLEAEAGGSLNVRDLEGLQDTNVTQNRSRRGLTRSFNPKQTLFVDESARNPVTRIRGLERELLIKIVEAARGNR